MKSLLAGPGVCARPQAWPRALSPGGKVMLVSEARVRGLFGSELEAAIRRRGFRVSRHSLPEGERAKTWGAVEDLLRAMLREGLGRDSGLVALGGGAVTDAAGFAAAVYLRGIPWVSVPTTLLGQVDSGLGGKTGVNLPEGKNLAGAFHEPLRVVCDTRFLERLPVRERVSGLAEAVKTGLVFDPPLWRYLRGHWAGLLAGEGEPTARVVRRTAAWKLRVVARDPRETRGRRELLNFGHTLGHALETAAGHGVLRHGEAVVWGLRAALRLSVARAGFPREEAREVERFLAEIPLPRLPKVSAARLLEIARRDKKARGGRLRFVLLKRLGRPLIAEGIAESDILEAVRPLLL